MSSLEIAGTVLGFINIVLLIRRSVWNFPAAMAMVTCIGVVLFEARLYSEAGLQVFFFLANVWGWHLWSRAKGADSAVPVRSMSGAQRTAWLAVTALASVAVGLILARHTDAVLPMADSAVAGTSIAAQILLALRRLENWALWIVVNAVSIPLYLVRDLPALAMLYAAFLAMSVVGWREWRRAERAQRISVEGTFA